MTTSTPHHHPTKRQALPTGQVTLVFTDIENSTTMLKHWGCERYAKLQDDHHQLIQAAITVHDGLPVDTMGDAEFVVFEEAIDALEAAVAIQRALETHDWLETGPVRVRIGLHTGEPMRQDDDYVGMAVYRAWRICAAGHGGQILISQEVLDALGMNMPPHLGLRDYGEVWLKGMDAPERLYQVLAEGVPDVDAAPVGMARTVRFGLYGLADGRGARGLAELVEALASAVTPNGQELHLTPGELSALASHRPDSLREYRASRLAAWIQPTYQLDDRFVPRTLRISPAEAGHGHRPAALDVPDGELADVIDQAMNGLLIVTGGPGSGKSTLLRQLEFRLAAAGLAGEAPLPYYVPLHQFGSSPSGAALSPGDWLEERWRRRYGDLPPLEQLLSDGRMVLILDGLDALPHRHPAEWRANTRLWKQFLHARVLGTTNRAVVSCRTLGLGLPLARPDEGLLQVELRPLDDRQVQRFLARHSPGLSGRMWRQIEGSELLEVLRAPFFLKAYHDTLAAGSNLPVDIDEIMTLLVDEALRREVENDNPHLLPGELLSERDLLQLVGGGSTRLEDGTPVGGLLTDALAELAFGLGIRGLVAGEGQARCAYDTACRLVGGVIGPQVIAAAGDLGLLDEDRASGEVFFLARPIQAYFASRRREPRKALGLRAGTVHAAS